MVRLVPFLWYTEKAEEAARFYASIIPDSRVDKVWSLQAESPSGPAGSVKVVEFTLAGQPMTAMAAGPLDDFNHAVSFVLQCDTQAEIDRFWDALSAGGEIEECGWLKDRYGLSWQIEPVALNTMMQDPDHAKAKRVADAMLTMKKLDLKALEEAYLGEPALAGSRR